MQVLERERTAALPNLPAGIRPGVVGGWGGAGRAAVWAWRPAGEHELGDGLRRGAARVLGGAIPRGLGRSYGDAAQHRGGVVIETRALTELHLDHWNGVATAGAGVTIGELLAAAASHGWTVPVV